MSVVGNKCQFHERGEIATVADVRYEREMLEYAVDAFLRSKGWKATCSTPGSFWLWTKTIDGREVLVDKETALSLTAHMGD